jgi:hypothetical protein
MAAITQADVDAALNELILATPSERAAEVEKDIAARKTFPLEAQIRWANRVRDIFEAAEVTAKYAPEPVTQTKNGKVASTNPWSAAAWNKTTQGGIVKRLGEVKAAELAKAAGCTLGSTKPNPNFN